MLTLAPPEIEEYALEHTSPLPEHLEDLTRATAERTGGAVMLTGPVQGMLLQSLVWASGARRVLEIGTFTGFSAQMMAAALPDDGLLITCDVNHETAKLAREFFDRSPHGHKIELRLGPALETLDTLEGPFKLVYIDADKANNVAYYERSLELLSTRGIIAVDNVLSGGSALDPTSAVAGFNRHVRDDPRVVQVLLPMRDGLMVIRKL